MTKSRHKVYAEPLKAKAFAKQKAKHAKVDKKTEKRMDREAEIATARMGWSR